MSIIKPDPLGNVIGGVDPVLVFEKEFKDYEIEDFNVPVWRGNLNAYWILGTALGLWFLFVHTPLVLSTRIWDISFMLHLGVTAVLYLACMWNTFHTPSHGTRYKVLHVWFGRIAVLMNIVGLGSGFLKLYVIGSSQPGKPYGGTFALGMTISGFLNIGVLCSGMISIFLWRHEEDPARRKSLLGLHQACMIGVFLVACGIPASIRLGEVLWQVAGSFWVMPLWTVFSWMVFLNGWMSRAIQEDKWL
mmetsp:Transcript_2868/g.6579  ORF Transcript_2868/g.6579 Transcript_2868/m.6579 type:complete len:247 (-) Transcript_2868:90-830(-)